MSATLHLIRDWLVDIVDAIAELLFGKTPPEAPQPALNRKQRRDIARMKPGELRMRRERTAIAQAKRRSSKRGDHGAKAKRAHRAGIEQAVRYFNVRMQQAYAAGLRDGKRQRRFWWPKRAAA